MTFITALLIGISVACVTWIATYYYQSKKLVLGRLQTNVSKNLSFPYEVETRQADVRRQSGEITIDQLGKNKMVQKLFLAGRRNVRDIKFFIFLSRAALYLPLGLIVIYALTSRFTINNVIRVLILGTGLFFGVRFVIELLRQYRQRLILRALPQMLDLIVVCVEAGLSFTSALERIIRGMNSKEPLVQEFQVMYNEFLNGIPLSEACQRMDKRCGVPDLATLLAAIVQSDQIGVSLGGSLRIQASELRDKLKQRIRTRAHRIPVKIVFPMVLIFVAFILLNLSYVGFQMGSVVGSVSAKSKEAAAVRGY